MKLVRGGLEADKACHDYPHGNGFSDECIRDALSVLSAVEVEQEQGSDSRQSRLPYRWMPLHQRRMLPVGSY